MNKYLALIGLIVASSSSAFAASLDRDLQAVILSDDYGKAVASANDAVKRVGQGFVAVTGNTSVLKLGNPNYYYYIPVYAVRVPLGPTPSKLVGEIVADLTAGLNSPVPS